MLLKKIIVLLVLFILLGVLAACTQPTAEAMPAVTPLPTRTSPAPTLSPTAAAPTSTPTPALAPTQTRTATATKTPPPTPRPSPTLTPYPTFDLAQVTPRGPLPTAVCPVEDPDMEIVVDRSSIIDFPTFIEAIWLLLDEGASLRQVAAAFNEAYQVEMAPLVDLTGDGLPELVVGDPWETIGIGCDDGEYKEIFNYWTEGWFWPAEVHYPKDMNLNGIPDIVITYLATSGANAVVDILEWDGAQFVSLVQINHGENSPDTSVLARALYWYENSWLEGWGGGEEGRLPMMNGGAQVDIRDLDGNGTLELIVTDSGPGHPDTLENFGPWRGKQVIFTWDGVHYLYSSLEMDAPIYRFQAVQDADRYFLLGNYERALALYQDAIFSDKLTWWSVDLRDYLNDVRYAEEFGDATPTPLPPDPNEYANLAAYSRYRIMLLQITQGQMESAQIVYDTLQEKYPAGELGYEYAYIATLFWTTFEETESMALSCASVTAYVEANPDMLFYLGDSKHEHGDQSHAYTAGDVCPFK